MKKIASFFLLLILSVQVFFPASYAKTNISGFITPKDIQSGYSSNISLKNNGSTSTTAYGLYVRQYAYVTPGNSCTSATTIYAASNNKTAGATVMPVTINANQSVPIGSNYLYNLIYGAIYYENIIIPASPPGCALPGCSWGSDSTVYNWCIYLGAMAPVSLSGSYTSKIPPAADNASSTGNYNYNLISSYITLGPISCDDRTLTCVDQNQQTQSFS